MDRIKQFQQAIIEVLNEYKGQFHQTSQDVWAETVIDDTNHHYQFLWTGWRGERHIFSVVFHIDILGEKIHIQQDNTEIGIANLLLEKGIRKLYWLISPKHTALILILLWLNGLKI